MLKAKADNGAAPKSENFTSRNRSCSGAVPRLPYVTQVIQIGFGPEDQFGIRNHCEPDLRDVVQYVDGDTPERPPQALRSVGICEFKINDKKFKKENRTDRDLR